VTGKFLMRFVIYFILWTSLQDGPEVISQKIFFLIIEEASEKLGTIT
jgi:hypothetical protein